ncbi:MAG: hypothetical protein J6X49_16045 [Victivallales bacterium]|nr:hypothetical protein [Victivallales bacterium]
MMVVLSAGLAVAQAADELKPAEAGSTACVCIDWWTAKHLWVGNPNLLNRKDRTTIRFDLTKYLAKGRVKKAELFLTVTPFGIYDENTFVLEQLMRERMELKSADTLSDDAEKRADFVIKSEDKPPCRQRIDVTDCVNGLLQVGHTQLVLRLRDATVENRGNKKNKAEGLEINQNELRLEILP